MSRSVAIGVQRRARRRSRISCAGFAAVFSRFACLPIRRRYLAVESAYGKFAGESAPHPCFKAVVLTGTICLRKPGFQGEFRESCSRHETQGLCATLNSGGQYLAEWGNS